MRGLFMPEDRTISSPRCCGQNGGKMMSTVRFKMPLFSPLLKGLRASGRPPEPSRLPLRLPTVSLCPWCSGCPRAPGNPFTIGVPDVRPCARPRA
ncbi:hypothetical protein NDU88_005134 [Pleurodeles waltl]|uniref:Uncharacterized protein n=1 Tax=Pleurodeles waltl TaxID=8319 RepID=A0AAV7PEM1_PLEWA|nr:hypothetical protein NDU88_005134 [Pleurodeles waltl]